MYIEPDWLELSNGKSFFYPAAGSDFSDAIDMFHEYVPSFLFCDTRYSRGLNLPAIQINAASYKLVRSEKLGNVHAELQSKRDERGKSYRSLEPSKLIETYRRNDGREICIVRRRGYGQMGIMEFQEHEIGVFMHRGDSAGEGGSKVRFLANKKQRFLPSSNLFDKLAPKFAEHPIIISDGSNSDISVLAKYHRVEIAGDAIYKEIANQEFQQYGFTWRCIGWLTPRYGPTLIWGLRRN